MRTVVIKEIQELSLREVTILLSNKAIQDEILEYARETESYWASEILDYIRPYLSDWSVGAYHYDNYIVIHDTLGFIRGVYELNKSLNLSIHDELNTLLDDANRIIDNMDDLNDDDGNYYLLIDELTLIVTKMKDLILDELVEMMEYFNDFETVENESDYVDAWLSNFYDSECIVENDKVVLL